jgi:hypothetical protein
MLGKKNRRPQDFAESLRLRQRNTTWPDLLRNNRSVDELFWRGSPYATAVQKAGALIFGLSFVSVGVSFVYGSTQTPSFLIRLVGGLMLCLGARLCFKVFFPTKRNNARRN